MSELIDELLIWEIRDKLSPPYQGLVMFSSSAAEYNTEQLVDCYEVDESDCHEAEYGGNDTLWIPLKVMEIAWPSEYKRIMEGEEE